MHAMARSKGIHSYEIERLWVWGSGNRRSNEGVAVGFRLHKGDAGVTMLDTQEKPAVCYNCRKDAPQYRSSIEVVM